VSVPSDLALNLAVCWAEIMMLSGFDWQTDRCTVCILDIITPAPGLIDTYSLCTPTHSHVSTVRAGEQILSLLAPETQRNWNLMDL